MASLLRKWMILVTISSSMLYLSIRIATTFSADQPNRPLAACLLLGAEAYFVLRLGLYLLQAWDPWEPEPAPIWYGRSVDVLILSHHEDLAQLRCSFEACARLHYPHRTYVLDQESRPEVRQLAAELGVVYLAQATSASTTASSLNDALAWSDGEFVIVLDATQVPSPHFITQLVGYFRDERLAFVQTPSAIWNFDAFSVCLDRGRGRVWEEQGLNDQVVQPGRNRWNAAQYTGSGAMFRRTALESIDGFAEKALAGELHTSLRLHAQGWHSFAFSKPLSIRQAPANLTDYLTHTHHRLRTRLGLLADASLLTLLRLRSAQQACYIASLFEGISGPFCLALYLSPILMLFGASGADGLLSGGLVALLAGCLALVLFGVKQTGSQQISVFHHEQFALITLPTQLRALLCRLLRRRMPKVATPGRAELAILQGLGLQIALGVIALLAMVWAWARVVVGGTPVVQPILPSLAVLVYGVLLGNAIRRASLPRERRQAIRYPVSLPVEYLDAERGDGCRYGVSLDLNTQGLSLLTYEPIPPGQFLYLTLRGFGQSQSLFGQVRQVTPHEPGPGRPQSFRHGVVLIHPEPRQIDFINRICLEQGVPHAWYRFLRDARGTLAKSLAAWLHRGKPQHRGVPRHHIRLPVILEPDTPEPTFTLSEDLSRHAVSVLTEVPLPLGTVLGYRLLTPLGPLAGRAEVIRSESVVLAGQSYYRCVLWYHAFTRGDRTNLYSLVAPPPRPNPPAVSPDTRPALPPPGWLRRGILLLIPLLMLEGVLFYAVYSPLESSRHLSDKRTAAELSAGPDRPARVVEQAAQQSRDPRTSSLSLGQQLHAKAALEAWLRVKIQPWHPQPGRAIPVDHQATVFTTPRLDPLRPPHGSSDHHSPRIDVGRATNLTQDTATATTAVAAEGQ